MIVLGADTHKRSHTVAAVAAVTGERGRRRDPGRPSGGRGAVAVARALDGERVWALGLPARLGIA